MLGLDEKSTWEEVEAVLDSLEYSVEYDYERDEYIVTCPQAPDFFVVGKHMHETMREMIDMVESAAISDTKFKDTKWQAE